jgi:hypothetical protein
MQTSGLVLDVYDDFNGSILRSLFSTPAEIPELVTQADALGPVDRAKLPDSVFALVLQNGDQQLRKFACTDPGNTTLSVLYFLKNAHKIPLEVQKTAASNLLTACSWYGLDDFAKEAGLESMAAKGLMSAAGHVAKNPLGTLATAVTAPALVQGTRNEIGGRMHAVRQFEQGGGGVATPEQLGHIMGKHGEATGTAVMPLSGRATKGPAPAATVKKTGAVLATNDAVQGKNPTAAPQSRVLRPHVNVTDKEPPKSFEEKKAAFTACPESYPGRYPLDTFEQVKKASVYFEEYGTRFAPAERREFCQNLVARADALAIDVSKTARKYASVGYAPMGEIKLALDARRRLVDDEVAFAVLDKLEEKIASTPVDLFCATLGEFDKAVGLDRHYDQGVFDPYFSTYGCVIKVAQDKDNWSWVDGNSYLTYADLKTIVKTRVPSLTQTFGDEFVKELRADPIGIFSSLPRDQKRMVAAMAVDNVPGADNNP